MNGLLIANKDHAAREMMTHLFQDDGYQIVNSDSVVNALECILDKSVQVVLIGGPLDEHQIAKFVPLLKKCNRNLSIILVADEMPLELLRKIRKEGIFYHALKPAEEEGWEEIRQVVACAFENYQERLNSRPKMFCGKMSLQGSKSFLVSLAIILACAPHVLATDSARAYSNGALGPLFAGFCALLIVAQILPALAHLFRARRTHTENASFTAPETRKN